MFRSIFARRFFFVIVLNAYIGFSALYKMDVFF